MTLVHVLEMIRDPSHAVRDTGGIHRATAARKLAQARATLIKRSRRELQARLQLGRTQFHGVLALLQGKLELSLRLFLTPSRDACNAIEARDRSFRDSPPASRSPALFRRGPSQS
jgi:hypothetical protein